MQDPSLAAVGVGMLLYISLLVYGITTMRSVVEKNTRVIELLILREIIPPLVGQDHRRRGCGLHAVTDLDDLRGLLGTYGVALAHAFNPNVLQLPSFHFQVVAWSISFSLPGWIPSFMLRLRRCRRHGFE